MEIMPDNVRVTLAELPPMIHAFTAVRDDFYTIVLNAKLSYEMQVEAYWHEIGHIQRGDYDKQCSAEMIEGFAHAV